jgi:hypothetical protein
MRSDLGLFNLLQILKLEKEKKIAYKEYKETNHGLSRNKRLNIRNSIISITKEL